MTQYQSKLVLQITWIPAVFEEFELVYKFLLLFSFHYYFQLVKRSTFAKNWGGCSPLPPWVSNSTKPNTSDNSTKPNTSLALLFAEVCNFVTVFINYLEKGNTEDLLI